MAERLNGPESSATTNNNQAELERTNTEVDQKQVETEQASAEHLARESAEKLEQLKDKPESNEKQKPAEKQVEKHRQVAERQKPTSAQKRAAFKTEISEIRQHLSPTDRLLSRVVHNPVIESFSQALEETVYRPSLLIGASIGVFLVGGGLYLFAKVRGYPVRGSEFLVGIVVGGVLGLIVELIVHFFRRKPKK